MRPSKGVTATSDTTLKTSDTGLSNQRQGLEYVAQIRQRREKHKKDSDNLTFSKLQTTKSKQNRMRLECDHVIVRP